MQVPFGDLKRRYAALKPAIDAATARVLASGWYILGPEVRAFEAAFASYIGVAHAIGVANGTEAISLVLAAHGIGAGDDVICVANAAMYEALAVVGLGARPVFVDIDVQTMNMDPALIEAAITPRTRAIVPVHLYGRMAAMEPILAIGARHGVPVIEDCAQAHGATYYGRNAGSIGVAGCFSFYPTKNLGGFGDGGALVTDNAELAAKVRRLRTYGWERKYDTVDRGGLNSRLDELQAAILAVMLPHLPAQNARRAAIAAQYDAGLHDVPGLTLLAAPDDGDHAYHLYVVRHTQRIALQTALQERGIGTDVHYPYPAHMQAAYAEFAPTAGLPVTERAAGEVLSLPMYPELTDDEVALVVTAVRDACVGLANL